jgi:hypothetical protein
MDALFACLKGMQKAHPFQKNFPVAAGDHSQGNATVAPQKKRAFYENISAKRRLK